MADILDHKRIFIVAVSTESETKKWVSRIEQHIAGTTVFCALDGLAALMKIENVPPHILIIEPDLPKTTKWQVIDRVLKDRKLKETAIIVLAPLPEEELFADEIVIGRVQFAGESDDLSGARVLAKALNFISHGETSEFYLRFLAPGEVLLREGEDATHVYLVKRGTMRAYLDRPDGEITVGRIEPGEFVGEMAYLVQGKRSANVIATSDCELIEIPIDHLDSILFSKPAWSKALMITLSKRVKRANLRLSKIEGQ